LFAIDVANRTKHRLNLEPSQSIGERSINKQYNWRQKVIKTVTIYIRGQHSHAFPNVIVPQTPEIASVKL
jgi:hypothetical protein